MQQAEIQIDERAETERGDDRADAELAAEQKAGDRDRISAQMRQTPAERPVFLASATISASRGPAPSALRIYIHVPSASSSSPASSIAMPPGSECSCGTQSSASIASMHTPQPMMLTIVPTPKLSPSRIARPIAAAPAMTEARP